VAEEAFFDGLEAQEAEESDQDWFTDWSEYFAVKSRTTLGLRSRYRLSFR